MHGDEDVDITSDVVEWGWGIRGDLVDESILLELCVSSLRRGHANLLCIVPSLVDASRAGPKIKKRAQYLYCDFGRWGRLVASAPRAHDARDSRPAFPAAKS